jgi:hypothetical protein
VVVECPEDEHRADEQQEGSECKCPAGHGPDGINARALQPRAPSADAAGVWMLIPIGGFALGLAVPRWWVVAAAVPFGAYVVLTNELEGNVGLWVAFVTSALLAIAIASGVALRKLRLRAQL